MKIYDKGRFSPPPVLPQHAQLVSEAIAAWDEVHARSHWLLGDETQVDGADFYVGDEELGHVHLGGEAHVATGIAVREALVAARLAKPFQWSSKFVVHGVAEAADVDRALWLFRLAYDRARGVDDATLVARVRAYER